MPERLRFPGLRLRPLSIPPTKRRWPFCGKRPVWTGCFASSTSSAATGPGGMFCLSDMVRVDQNQCRDLYALLVESCAILDMPVPQLYIDQRPVANAFTFCVDSPIIVFYSGLIDLLDEDEWRVVLGHELGHIKAGHVLYRQIAIFLANLLMRLGGPTFGLARGLGLDCFMRFSTGTGKAS